MRSNEIIGLASPLRRVDFIVPVEIENKVVNRSNYKILPNDIQPVKSGTNFNVSKNKLNYNRCVK